MLAGQQLDNTEQFGSVLIMFEKVVVLNDNFYINWYLHALLDPIHAILKSFDVNFLFGTIRNDSLKQKGQNSPSTPSGDSVFHSTSKPSRWRGCGWPGPT